MLFIVIKTGYPRKLEIKYLKLPFLVLQFKKYNIFAYLEVKYVSGGNN